MTDLEKQMLAALELLLEHMKNCRRAKCPPDNYALAAAEAVIRAAKPK